MIKNGQNLVNVLSFQMPLKWLYISDIQITCKRCSFQLIWMWLKIFFDIALYTNMFCRSSCRIEFSSCFLLRYKTSQWISAISSVCFDQNKHLLKINCKGDLYWEPMSLRVHITFRPTFISDYYENDRKEISSFHPFSKIVSFLRFFRSG